MLMPLGMTILTRAAGPERVGRVMAVLGIPMLLGPIFGPILGGWLIDSASWHWIFLINLPIGIAAMIYAAIVLPKDQVEPSETFDWLGMLLLSPGLALFLYGVSDPRARPVIAAEVLVPMVLGSALIVAFVRGLLNRRNIHPLVDLRLFKNRNLTVAVIAMLLFAIAVLRRLAAVPALLPAGPRRGRPRRRPAARAAGHRRDAHHADRRHAGRPDRPRQDRAHRHRGDHRRHGRCSPRSARTRPTAYMLGALFVMGLGMGGTMMPIMTAALRP